MALGGGEDDDWSISWCSTSITGGPTFRYEMSQLKIEFIYYNISKRGTIVWKPVSLKKIYT